MRKRRTTPVPAPAAPVAAPQPSAELLARLAALEARTEATQPAPWTPAGEQQEEQAAHLAANTRTAVAPCPACGVAEQAGGKRHLVLNPEPLGISSWLCEPCTQAIEPGWGSQRSTILNRQQAHNNLACAAAGIDPSHGFLTLAQRYGLRFLLAQDAKGAGDGTAWSHLPDGRDEWQRVGVLATRRAAAGWGVLPATRLTPEQAPDLGWVHDWSAPGGGRPGYVHKAPEPVTREQLDATLRAEEAAIEAALTKQAQTRRREASEARAAAVRDEREADVKAKHRAAQQRLKREYEAGLRGLRSDMAAVLGKGAA